MQDPVGDIARQIKSGQDTGARLRVGVVVDTGVAGAQLDILGAAWVPVAHDVPDLVAGDRVYAIQQGSVVVVTGRLTGTPSGVPLGSVTTFAGSSTKVPDGWLICDGRAVSRTTYAALFAVVGTSYGAGDGSTTFLLPDLRDRMPVGVSATKGRGVTGGAERVTLTTAELPAHTHGSAGAHTHAVESHTHVQDDVADGTTAGVADMPTSSTPTSSSAGAHTHASVGGGGSHENMPPWVAMYQIIRAV